MSNFIIEKDFFEVFPGANIGVILIDTIDNTSDGYPHLINEALTIAKDNLDKDIFSENTTVVRWREAYAKFKKKKGARCSIESLLKRAYNDNGLNSINPLVDLYNVTSLRYQIPCGGEDIDTFDGDLRLTKAIGNEHFEALGDDKAESPYPDEIVYKDDKGIVCRCFNWREAKRTLLTDKTTRAFIVMEVVEKNEVDNLNNALNYFQELLLEEMHTTSKKYILNKDNNSLSLK